MNKVVSKVGAIAAATLLVSCSETENSVDPGFVSVGHGGPTGYTYATVPADWNGHYAIVNLQMAQP